MPRKRNSIVQTSNCTSDIGMTYKVEGFLSSHAPKVFPWLLHWLDKYVVVVIIQIHTYWLQIFVHFQASRAVVTLHAKEQWRGGVVVTSML